MVVLRVELDLFVVMINVVWGLIVFSVELMDLGFVVLRIMRWCWVCDCSVW